jgi:hypothetical protein
MDGRKSPAPGGDNFRERKLQRLAMPIFHQIVKHLKVSGIENDARWIAISKTDQHLPAKWSGLRTGYFIHDSARFPEKL